MRTATAAMTLQKNLLVTGSAWVWLLQITVDDATKLYYTNNTKSLTFDGQVYTPQAMKFDAVRSSGGGDLDSWKIAIQNVDQIMVAYLELGKLINRQILAYIVNSDLLSASANRYALRAHIISADASEEWVSLTTGVLDIRRIKVPRSCFGRDFCRFFYGDADCGSAGAGPCDKTPNTCLLTWNNYTRFGGFPGIPLGST